MNANINVLNPNHPKKVLLLVSNPAVSPLTGWPIGVWASELIHPYWAFIENGYEVEIATPKGGKVEIDAYSDPRDTSEYSAHDILSLGFLSSPTHMRLLENTRGIDQVNGDVEAFGGHDPAALSALMVLLPGSAPPHQRRSPRYLGALETAACPCCQTGWTTSDPVCR